VQPKEENVPPDNGPENTAPHAGGDAPALGHTSVASTGEAVAKQVQQEVQTARRRWYHALRTTRFLLMIYLIMLGLFAGLAFWVHTHPVLAVDVWVTQEFQENQAPWLRTLMFAVSFLGSAAWLFTGLIILTVLAFWLVRLRLEALTIAFVCLTSSLLNLAIKLIIARPRPAAPLVSVLQHASGNSFPSGHVMSYMAYWGLLFTFSIVLFSSWRWWRVLLLIISGLFVVLVGPSRIYLGDHWASDVLGAYLIEGLWLWFCLWLYVKLAERGVFYSSRAPATRWSRKPTDQNEIP
jgi:undecaprenyl-diphosphatase